MIKQSLDNGLTLRPSRPSDGPFLQSLHDAVRSDLDALKHTPELHRQILDLQYRAQTQGYGDQCPDAWYFIVEHLHTSVGKVTIDFSGERIHLVDIAFIPAYCGKGHGQVVLQSIQQIAARLNVPLTLSVFSQDSQLIQWYRRLGFASMEQRGAHILMRWLPLSLRESLPSSQLRGATYV
ncbi:GNAT family N-acetyltransferase [Ferrimonas sp. YFM]|uniref:GNAT family N-acetyltransferase n=1 Tax=Ferrimonas sp. YFM TaxID=3028878 RepID=UPI002572C102|nr:GNAT family N-acetyltransferase [Ferrimonas sp. YFM]BDY06001.1 N-acetyltransferase GCN5 [Ferrimonas sp. YFM]